MSALSNAVVLIVEDGDEYLENLGRFVPGPHYLQAHSGAAALQVLAQEAVDLVYLDMRFDRIAREELLGDHPQLTREHGGDPGRAWRFLQNNQGLFVLDALWQAGHRALPVILAYDFSGEERRWQHLASAYPPLTWVPDAVTPEKIAEVMSAQLARWPRCPSAGAGER